MLLDGHSSSGGVFGKSGSLIPLQTGRDPLLKTTFRPNRPASPYMASDFHALEPFPLFIDSVPPADENYFSNMNLPFMLSSTPTSLSGKPQIPLPAKVSNYLRLRYYQYEVTFGLYIMTAMEKIVLNGIILAIFGALSYALFLGLEPFVMRMFCRMLYYITGAFLGAEELCAQ